MKLIFKGPVAPVDRRCGNSFTVTVFALACLLLGLQTPIQAQAPITAIAFSPDGGQLVIGSQAGLRVVDLNRNLNAELATELEFINDIRFSNSGKKLAVVGGSPGESGSIEIYDWLNEEAVFRTKISDDVLYGCDWGPADHRLAIAGHDTDCWLLNLPARKIERTWSEHSRPVKDLQFLGGEKLLVSAGFDQTIRLWETGRANAKRSLNNHTAEVNAISVSPEKSAPNRMIVSVGEDKTVRFWQPQIGRMIRFARLESRPLTAEWSLDGQFVVVGCEDGRVYGVDMKTVRVAFERQLWSGAIYCVARHPGQNLFAVGGAKGNWKIVTP